MKQHVLTGKALKLSYNCVRQTHFREDNGNKKKIMTGIKKKLLPCFRKCDEVNKNYVLYYIHLFIYF